MRPDYPFAFIYIYIHNTFSYIIYLTFFFLQHYYTLFPFQYYYMLCICKKVKILYIIYIYWKAYNNLHEIFILPNNNKSHVIYYIVYIVEILYYKIYIWIYKKILYTCSIYLWYFYINIYIIYLHTCTKIFVHLYFITISVLASIQIGMDIKLYRLIVSEKLLLYIKFLYNMNNN